MYKLFYNLYIGTSGKPSPTDIEETFVLNFVGDGFLHVPFTKIALQFLCGNGTPYPYDGKQNVFNYFSLFDNSVNSSSE